MDGARHLCHDWYPKPLPDNVEIGAASWLYSSFAFLHYRSRRPHGVRIGHDTGVYNGTFFDLGPEGEVSIGNFCTLVGAIICSNSRVSIADYVFIAHEVTIADHFAAFPPSLPATLHRDCVHRDISIGEGAWIGARAILLSGARIGEGAVVGAGCVVDCEVPAFQTATGNPVRILQARAEGLN